jgi:hypothetical protein
MPRTYNIVENTFLSQKYQQPVFFNVSKTKELDKKLSNHACQMLSLDTFRGHKIYDYYIEFLNPFFL